MFVCATGNNPLDNDLESNYFYPSFYGTDLYEDKIPNIISVGRIDINDERPASANWGYNTIDIYAPGQYILSTFPTNMCNENANECEISGHKAYGYHYMSGSSMSTPHVSGVAALLLSVNPNLTAAQIKECILGGAENITITTGSGEEQEVKKLNAFGAFRYLMDNYPDNTSVRCRLR